ncbi:MAG: polysaccharide deacetylase family protein [Intrasporangium sp.]|uniref:polysaccharide deacetylase family protein n=1 Tax=Intrasporangium sp. TaxID=1925024 RepID=UPI003F7ECD8F
MDNEGDTVDRRTLLRGGLASAVALGSAACSAPMRPLASAPTPGTAASSRDKTGKVPGASSTAPGPEEALPLALHTSGPDIEHGPRSGSAACLTFHGAGDPALTREVLRVCGDHGARITVFAVGTWLTGHPDLGRAIVAAGHDLGNHTWSHQPMLTLDRPAAESEIRDGARAVAAIKGSNPLLFRPSGTQHSTALLRAAARTAGYFRCISYDVDPMDYLDPGSATVVRRTLGAVQAGSIVSLHLGHRGTVEALPSILSGLADRGLAPRTVSELLA